MEWRPIESAPRDGTTILCWRPNWDPCLLRWKTNPRIAEHQSEYPRHTGSYFGDLEEDDDYELALPGGGPTHWCRIPPTPDTLPAPWWKVGDELRWNEGGRIWIVRVEKRDQHGRWLLRGPGMAMDAADEAIWNYCAPA